MPAIAVFAPMASTTCHAQLRAKLRLSLSAVDCELARPVRKPTTPADSAMIP
jgi:hypothetical protein